VDDGDPDDVGASVGEGEPGDRGASGRGRECKRLRALVRREQPPPGEDLEAVGDEEEKPRRREEAGMSARQRPRSVCESAGSQDRQAKRDNSRSGGEREPGTRPTTEASQPPSSALSVADQGLLVAGNGPTMV
jgi:hypothetical protein